jgi:hypothetical protein
MLYLHSWWLMHFETYVFLQGSILGFPFKSNTSFSNLMAFVKVVSNVFFSYLFTNISIEKGRVEV